MKYIDRNQKFNHIAGLIEGLYEQESKEDKLRFGVITTELCNLHSLKNKAYGDSFACTYRRLGPISALTRIYDKCNRLNNLFSNPNIDHLGESKLDTLRDMASYCIMTIVEIQIAEMDRYKFSGFSEKGEFGAVCKAIFHTCGWAGMMAIINQLLESVRTTWTMKFVKPDLDFVCQELANIAAYCMMMVMFLSKNEQTEANTNEVNPFPG